MKKTEKTLEEVEIEKQKGTKAAHTKELVTTDVEIAAKETEEERIATAKKTASKEE
jgi:hypothetical protein